MEGTLEIKIPEIWVPTLHLKFGVDNSVAMFSAEHLQRMRICLAFWRSWSFSILFSSSVLNPQLPHQISFHGKSSVAGIFLIQAVNRMPIKCYSYWFHNYFVFFFFKLWQLWSAKNIRSLLFSGWPDKEKKWNLLYWSWNIHCLSKQTQLSF